MRQAKQCKEELLRMAKTTPGEFWPVTPRSAFRLMAAAEQLQADLDQGDFCEKYGWSFLGEAEREAWKAQGPVDVVEGLGGDHYRHSSLRDRMFYFRLRDCFTKIAQRIACGKKPHPRTHAELWACCLLFDADDTIMGDGHMFDEVYGPQFDALPEHSWDEDFEITRYALLGPVYGSLKPRPKKRRQGGVPSTPNPPAETLMEQLAAAVGNDPTPLERQVMDLVALGQDGLDDDPDEGIFATGDSCVFNLKSVPICRWFYPFPQDFFKTTPSTEDAASLLAPWDSQLSSSGWKDWPVVEKGHWGLVYVVSMKKFGYYDDDDFGGGDECMVYIGEPMVGAQGSFPRAGLRKPPFEGEYRPGGFVSQRAP